MTFPVGAVRVAAATDNDNNMQSLDSFSFDEACSI